MKMVLPGYLECDIVISVNESILYFKINVTAINLMLPIFFLF